MFLCLKIDLCAKFKQNIPIQYRYIIRFLVSFTAYRKWNTKFGMRIRHTLWMQKKTVKDTFVSQRKRTVCSSYSFNIHCLSGKDFRNRKKWKIEIDKTHFCDKNMHYVCKMIALKQTLEKTKTQQQQNKSIANKYGEWIRREKKAHGWVGWEKSRSRPCLGNADRKTL